MSLGIKASLAGRRVGCFNIDTLFHEISRLNLSKILCACLLEVDSNSKGQVSVPLIRSSAFIIYPSSFGKPSTISSVFRLTVITRNSNSSGYFALPTQGMWGNSLLRLSAWGRKIFLGLSCGIAWGCSVSSQSGYSQDRADQFCLREVADYAELLPHVLTSY